MMDISKANLSLFHDFKGIFMAKSFFSLGRSFINEFLMTIDKLSRSFRRATNFFKESLLALIEQLLTKKEGIGAFIKQYNILEFYGLSL
jgi:hypothetical protein